MRRRRRGHRRVGRAVRVHRDAARDPAGRHQPVRDRQDRRDATPARCSRAAAGSTRRGPRGSASSTRSSRGTARWTRRSTAPSRTCWRRGRRRRGRPRRSSARSAAWVTGRPSGTRRGSSPGSARPRRRRRGSAPSSRNADRPGRRDPTRADDARRRRYATIATRMSDELSPSQAAARVGATTRSVQRWIASGRLPARRVGGRWRVATDAIDAFVAADGTDRAANRRAAITPIRTLFIANRGEIATRITRTCDRLGIRAVVPDTDGPDGLDLLDIDAVVDAARAAGADAVHPGFGFLAENADFAEAVVAAGIRWVGPPPAAIRAMGDKAAARRLAASLGRPDPRRLRRRRTSPTRHCSRPPSRVGFPMLVKPAAGGGGKGMRTVREPHRLAEAIGAARREAAAAFGDDRLILERLVVGARHVEIQVLFDGYGAGVSARRTRLLDPAPPPEGARGGAVAGGRRPRCGSGWARRRCRLAARGRLRRRRDVRVPARRARRTGLPRDEHAAPGGAPGHRAGDRPRPRRRSAADRRGRARWASTGRPAAPPVTPSRSGSMPRTPRPGSCRRPGGSKRSPGRPATASASTPGSSSAARSAAGSTRCWPRSSPGGRTGPTALERLAGALDRTVVLGVVTNLRFLRWLVRQPVVRAGRGTDRRRSTRIWPPDDWAEHAAIPEAAWTAAADLLLAAGDPRRPVGRRLAAQRRAIGPARGGRRQPGRRDAARGPTPSSRRRARIGGRPRRATPSISTSPAGASRSGWRRRPMSTPRPGRPSPMARPGRPARSSSWRRCPAPS